MYIYIQEYMYTHTCIYAATHEYVYMNMDR